MIEATFQNPYLTDNERWVHGFMLRGKPGNIFHVIYISDAIWGHDYRLGKGEPDIALRQEVFSGIDKTPGGKNRLRLVAIGDQGWLFINNQPQGQLDLSVLEFDRVILMLYEESAGAVTRFENFTVWKWHPSLQTIPLGPPSATNLGPITSGGLPYEPVYGPSSGVIIHEVQRPTNLFEVFRGPLVEGDLMVEATFHNPSAGEESNWNYGFLLRNSGLNKYQWIYLNSGRWVSKWRPSADDSTHTIRNSHSSLIDRTAGGKNQVRLVIIGDSVTIFINGKHAGYTTILGNADNSPVALVVDDEREGVTRFEGFTVWKWHPSLQELPDDN